MDHCCRALLLGSTYTVFVAPLQRVGRLALRVGGRKNGARQCVVTASLASEVQAVLAGDPPPPPTRSTPHHICTSGKGHWWKTGVGGGGRVCVPPGARRRVIRQQFTPLPPNVGGRLWYNRQQQRHSRADHEPSGF
jgi:hypothetical protein